jgi:hypothetical protein
MDSMCTFLKFIYIIKTTSYIFSHIDAEVFMNTNRWWWWWSPSTCQVLAHVVCYCMPHFSGLPKFSSCLACMLLFSILLTCCFQLVWQVYINMMIYHHGLLSLVRGSEVIFPQTMMKWLYCHELIPRASLIWTGCTMRIWGWGLDMRHCWSYFLSSATLKIQF